ncbi:MAG: type II toxin-antitoxin system YoeB family toxin [Lentisphaerota bacterium]
MHKIEFTRTAYRDFEKLDQKEKVKLKEILLNKVQPDPFSGKKLIGDLKGLFSVRLSYKDRIVYSIDQANNIIYIHRVKTHYGD